jgi:2-(1,2-epoxy-1,2-dihydrophenyl)acetyl-CoA isomerase
MLNAAEALRIGLVNRVFAHDQLMNDALELAERIASGPLVSYRYMKANVNASGGVDFRTMLDREAETHLRCGQTEDHQEGVNAFMDKRQPVFRGR